jgi:hypothetical protein
MFGALPFFLFLSVLLNTLLVWYIIDSIRLKKRLESDLEIIYDEIGNFVDHTENVHSLEMYYGDQNLQNLIDHSRNLINQLIDFQVLYLDAEVEIESDNGEEEETTKTEE